MASMETYGEYNGGDGGCDCRVDGSSRAPGGLLAGLLLLGLLLVRRRL
jgi:MYXO-CTERM domain-containing protein